MGPLPELSDQDIRGQLQAMQASHRLAGKRLLVIIPDQTRTAPVDRFFRLLHEVCGPEASRLDFLIALGTHPFLTEAQKLSRVGITASQKARLYPRTRILNHRWDRPGTFRHLGRIDGKTMGELSGGAWREDLEISINRRILDYDRLLVLGPVYPHEIAGFSGRGKYLFPGICGPDFIDASHWLAALRSNLGTIGVRDTPARALIERACALVPTPVTYLNLVVAEGRLAGLFIGEEREPWETGGGAVLPPERPLCSAGLPLGALDPLDPLRGFLDRGQGLLQAGADRGRRRGADRVRPVDEAHLAHA